MYRVKPHLFSANYKPCWKIQEKAGWFRWKDYIATNGKIPVWWTYEEASQICDHMNGILPEEQPKTAEPLKRIK